jgi:site-specific DNA recombinase
MRIAAPELRIVPDDLWSAAHDRRAKSRETYLQTTDGVLFGRRCDRDSKYLLSGFARCAVCGGGMLVKSRDHRSQRPYFYACSWHHDRGEAACGNNIEARIELVERAVLDAIDQDVLRPDIVREALDRAIVLMTERTDPGRVAALEFG